MIRVLRLRRLVLHLALVAGCAVALWLWAVAPVPGWSDAQVDPWAPPVAGTPAQLLAAAVGPAGSPTCAGCRRPRLPLGEVTLLVEPARRGEGAPLVERDGLPVGISSGRPLTVLAASGDAIAVAAPPGGAWVRVLAVGRGVVFTHRRGWVWLRRGVSVLGRVLIPAARGQWAGGPRP
jgi:hypothetical protein